MENLLVYLKYYLGPNILPVCIVMLFLIAIKRMSKKEYWKTAWKQVKGNKVAMLSFWIIIVYLLVGLLDSIKWQSQVVNKEGNRIFNNQGTPIFEPKKLSLFDRLPWVSTLRTSFERTYSKPFAKKLLMKENETNPAGKIVQVHPKLKYPSQHPLGTNKDGSDVLYLSFKGIRTAIIIGGITTLIVIPFAMFFGIIAGFFGGIIDDIIQYVYSTLASIPSVLLIVSFMLLFGKGLTQLCIIMGITSWTGLCRLLRAETLKLRELDYVQAAMALGVSKIKIVYKHIAPNVMHIVLISFVLRFSGLVLAEAVLSYIGIGVESGTGSWGNMINMARLELSQEPIVWWSLCGAFVFMFGLILPVNLFGDALRDALDPKLRTR